MAPLPKDRKSSQKGPSIFDQFGMPKSSLDITNPRPPSALELGTSSSKGQRTELQENQQLPTANQILARRQTGILKRFYYQENILALQQSCSIVGPLIRAARARASRVSRSDPVNTVEDFRIRRVGDKTEFWAPILILSGVQQNGTKTLGFIRVKQSPFPFMASASGWTSTNKSSEDLLDSERWTDAVIEFAGLINFGLKKHGYDRERDGEFCACHVEKKLTLYFACDTLIDTSTGELNWKNIEMLRKQSPPLEAELVVSRAPCKSCLAFMAALEEVTGIKFTLKVCETMVDGDDPRPCNKRKCKLDRKELITERKKSEVLRTEILTRAATAKRKKESKKAERRAQSNSTTLNITINPNLMVVIPSNIVIVEPRQPPTTSKTSMTPKTSKTPYRPSATPIPPSSSPKALETSHLNIPSASNMVKSVQSPKKANVPNSRMTGAPVGPPALETAGRMALSVKKPVSYQQPRQADRASLSTITSPVSLSSPRSADRTFLSVKKPMSSRASKKVDQNTSALISPLVSPPSPRTADRSVFHNKKALAYQASKKAKRHITSSTLSQSENYRVSKRSNNASRSIISTPKSQTAPTMVTRSKGLLTLISLFGFQGLERKRHKSKKDRSRDFPRIGLFWQ